MAIVNPYVVNQLRHLVFYHLDNELVQNALFVASRLHAYDSRSAESSYLVALCHLRLGQIRLAHEISKLQGSRGVHLGCSYVFAQACLLLPQQQMDGIAALERCRGLWKLRNNWSKFLDVNKRRIGCDLSDPMLTWDSWHRQTLRSVTTMSTGCGGDLHLTREALACTWRLQEGSRSSHRGIEAESIHVGRLHRPM